MTQSFKVNIAVSVLDDLRERILSTRWIKTRVENQSQSEISYAYLKDLASYWANRFEWRIAEARINTFPHFITIIDGYKIHYLHIKGKGQHRLPLIISHGWPGSFVEMLKIIPLLTGNDEISFDLVIPSLPGFGFSDKPDKPGVNTSFIAELWVKLMSHLGYEKFIAQGGDFGATIATQIALKHPESLIGLHLNYIPFNYQPFIPPGEKLTKGETEARQKINQFFQREGGYAQIQMTKSLTLSHGLNDSPVGLCAWILQIFKSFSDPTAQIEELFDREDLLTHITLYWVTETIYSSMGLYREIIHNPLDFTKEHFIQVPVGIARYPYPENFPARKFIERGYNVKYWKDLPAGGHFAAMEQPEIFAENIREFAKSTLLGSAHTTTY